MSQRKHCRVNITHNTLQVMRDTLHMTHYTLHITHYTLHIEIHVARYKELVCNVLSATLQAARLEKRSSADAVL